jgi:hypothetical protein
MAVKSLAVELSSYDPDTIQTQIDAALGTVSITATTVPNLHVIGFLPRPVLVILYDEAAE